MMRGQLPHHTSEVLVLGVYFNNLYTVCARSRHMGKSPGCSSAEKLSRQLVLNVVVKGKRAR